MFRLSRLRVGLVGGLVAALTLWAAAGGFFAREIVAEIAILAILVIALDLAAGFGGMVSLAHGAIMGAGAYAYALATGAGMAAWPAAGCAVIAAALLGGVIVAVSARLQGIFFLMATLAFGQMIWSFPVRADALGGDNGLGGIPRPPLPFLDSADPLVFALYARAVMVLCCLLAAAILQSRFGRAYEAIRDNPARAAAIGLPPGRIRSIGFALSSALAGVAGVLAAQHMQFVSPELMVWTTSGEALIVLILGGIGTLSGPVLGAALFVVVRHWASGLTSHWHLIVGAMLIAVVLAGGRGIMGRIERGAQHADG